MTDEQEQAARNWFAESTNALHAAARLLERAALGELTAEEARSTAASLETMAGQGRRIARQLFPRGDQANEM